MVTNDAWYGWIVLSAKKYNKHNLIFSSKMIHLQSHCPHIIANNAGSLNLFRLYFCAAKSLNKSAVD